MEIGYVKKQSITKEMEESYLDYAMSVIISRALPDVRDGLKPVHRRILYTMQQMGLWHTAKYRKSATVVGSALGWFHPHGDMAVYDAMARMAQNFAMRYPLVDGQGNWGSSEDSQAAMRYTEARLTKIAEEMLTDIDKETVNWVDNYDGTRQEPTVLPAKLPQLLLNGGMGIAVGMSTDIPPHNLTELVEGIVYLIDHPKATVQEICQFVKGPDFPTGGMIFDRNAIIQAYSAGRGPIVSRAKAEIVERTVKGGGQFQIVVTEMTYRTNKAELISKMADLVKDKKIVGIKDIRDESDKDGVRIVIDLKSDSQPQKVLNRLYKLTDLQKTYHLNMLALVNGLQPQVLSLKEVLEEFVKHRQEVIVLRTKYDLKQAKERAHILEGLSKALDHIDAVIQTIKKSPDREVAHKNLMSKFKLSDRQATAILEMRLQTLAGLEQKKIKDELEEKRKLIKALEEILKSPKKVLGIIKKELQELKDKYGDERRTKVFVRPLGKMTDEELIPNEECVVIVTQGGYIKRVNPKDYRTQKRGGKGVVGITPREEDIVGHFLCCSTHDNLLFFTGRGRVFQSRAYEIPEASRVARGHALVNILSLEAKEAITAVVPVGQEKDAKYLFMATKNGIIKRTKIEEFGNVRRNGLIAISLKKEDQLKWARLTSGQNQIIFVTAKGQSIRFNEKDARPMGRNAAGVKGIQLKAGDEVVKMDVISVEGQKAKSGYKLLVITENGYGKRTEISSYKIQKRGGMGIKTAKLTPKTGLIIDSWVLKNQEEDLVVISRKGQVIRTKIKDISVLSRSTQGVRIMKMKQGDKAASTACV